MSYTMIHLEVAYKLLNKCQQVSNKGDFMLGAIAPDAVHFNENYSSKLKERSHIWDCGPKWGITLDSDKWKKNVCTFWKEHKDDDNRDFIAGYCVHILTDWLNDIKIWSPFRNENMRGDNVQEIYHIYGQEAYGSDQWLYQHSVDNGAIMKLLSEGTAYTIPERIAKEDIECQKKYILFEQYKEKGDYDINNYRYCKKEVLLAFIDECVDAISEISQF